MERCSSIDLLVGISSTLSLSTPYSLKLLIILSVVEGLDNDLAFKINFDFGTFRIHFAHNSMVDLVTFAKLLNEPKVILEEVKQGASQTSGAVDRGL